jgi:hypothetical protein
MSPPTPPLDLVDLVEREYRELLLTLAPHQRWGIACQAQQPCPIAATLAHSAQHTREVMAYLGLTTYENREA